MSTTVTGSKRHLNINADEFAGDLNGTVNTATTATTQSTSDNSTKVATTAFVKAQGYGTSNLALGTTSSTALAGNTSLLAIGTTSTTAMAGNTSIPSISGLLPLAGGTMSGAIAMGDNDVTGIDELKFNSGTKLGDASGTSYVQLTYAGSSEGGIIVYDGDGTRQGYLYADGGVNSSFGLLDGTGSWAVRCYENQYVELRYDDSTKLRTSAAGITVTGAVAATTFSGDLNGTINTATTAATQSAGNNSTKVATTAYADAAVAALIDNAPANLNTLNELAEALNDDDDAIVTINTALGTKLPLAGGTITGNLQTNGNTFLGNASGDYVHVNDKLYVGATDSGDSEFWFGEGTTGDVNYGTKWRWDSGYTHSWYTVNNSTETLMMSFMTNDTSQLKWFRMFDMNNKKITELATPTAGTDAATKAYVDGAVIANTDTQDLSISGQTLSLTNGGSVTLPTQTSVSGNAGSVTNGVYTTGAQTIAGIKEFTSEMKLGTYNSTVGGILSIHGTTANKKSTIKTTNGNLHIDAADGHSTYINYYTGASGVAGNTIFGTGDGGASGAFVRGNGGIVGTAINSTGVVGGNSLDINGAAAINGKVVIEGDSADWSTTTPGLTTGSLHFDPGASTNNFGNAITFGASDAGSGANAQAGIYIRSDGGYGTKMVFCNYR